MNMMFAIYKIIICFTQALPICRTDFMKSLLTMLILKYNQA